MVKKVSLRGSSGGGAGYGAVTPGACGCTSLTIGSKKGMFRVWFADKRFCVPIPGGLLLFVLLLLL
jgi:hypothetical protein